MLVGFPVLVGSGASGINFLAVPGAPDAASARDYVLLKSLQDGLHQLASNAFAPAYGNSTAQAACATCCRSRCRSPGRP